MEIWNAAGRRLPVFCVSMHGFILIFHYNQGMGNDKHEVSQMRKNLAGCFFRVLQDVFTFSTKKCPSEDRQIMGESAISIRGSLKEKHVSAK